MEDPPHFQAAAQCVACRSSFTTFKRRHHCRACGRSFCNDHSANQKSTACWGNWCPASRVLCEGLVNWTCQLLRTENAAYKPADSMFSDDRSAPNVRGAHATAVESSRSRFTKLNLEAIDDISSKDNNPTQVPSTSSYDCTCGVPLCICEAPLVSEVVSSVTQTHARQKSREPRKVSSNVPSPFKQSTVRSSVNSTPSFFFSSGKPSQGNSHPLSKSYDLSGEGIREAVKNGDVSAVRELILQGVDVNYVDKQGMSLIHLAAMFNFTEITFILMDGGANLHAKNAQGETALDCAQTTLEHKMRYRIDSTSQ